MTEASVAIASGATGVNIDVTQLLSFALNQLVARQIVSTGDPNNPYAIAAVQRTPATGVEFGLMVKGAPNDTDMLATIYTLQQILSELQNLIELLGGLPMTERPFNTVSAQ